jgi:hypothetical protein
VSNATVVAARSIEATVIEQVNATADALAQIGQSALAAALERVREESARLKARIMLTRAAIAEEVMGTVLALSELAADLGAGLALPEPARAPEPPALPAPVKQESGVRSQESEEEPEPAAEQPPGQPEPEQPAAQDEPEPVRWARGGKFSKDGRFECRRAEGGGPSDWELWDGNERVMQGSRLEECRSEAERIVQEGKEVAENAA